MKILNEAFKCQVLVKASETAKGKTNIQQEERKTPVGKKIDIIFKNLCSRRKLEETKGEKKSSCEWTICEVSAVISLKMCVCFLEVFLRARAGFCATSSSSTLRQTKLLTSPARHEAVAVSVAAAVPEVGTFTTFAVEEPHEGVFLAAADVRSEQTGVWMETRDRFTCNTELTRYRNISSNQYFCMNKI